MKNLVRWVVIGLGTLSLFALVSGCATQSTEKMHKLLSAYNRLLQEGDAESAAQFVDPMRREAFLAEMNSRTGHKEIQDFAIRPFTVKPDAKQLKVKILRSIIDKRSYESSEKTIEQEWVLRGKSWLLIGGDF